MRLSLGGRGSSLRALAERRTIDLERTVQRVDSRRLAGAPGFTSRRVQKSGHGWSVGTWVELTSGTWSAAQTSDSFDPGLLAVVIRVVDGDTVDVATAGYVQIPSLSFSAWATYYVSTTAGDPTETKPTAPDVVQPIFVGHEDGWIEILGAAVTAKRSVYLAELADVDPVTVGAADDGDLLSWSDLDGLWIAVSASATLGTRAALSVLGRSGNTAGAAADIVASTTGDVLQMGASSLVWGQLATASYGDGSVTAVKLGTDVVLDTLNDVTITTAAAKDFIRRDAANAAWVNESLGDLLWVSATREFALDGGTAASAASVVGIGKAASRLLVSFVSSFDFLLSGLVGSGTDISARIRATGTGGPIGFYDQATTTFASGTEVMEWGTNATPGSRYFRYKIPLHVFDGSSSNLVLTGTSKVWTIADDVTPTSHLTIYAAGADAYGARMALGSDLDLLGGRVFYADRASGTSSSRIELISSDGTWFQSGNLSHRAGNTLRLFGSGSGGVVVGVNGSDKLGFWGTAAVSKTTVSDPSAITVSGTATGTDQAMVNALKTDVTNLRTSLLAAIDALQACGIF